MTLKKYPCVICGKMATEVVKKVGSIEAVICKNDGHVFLDPRPSKEEYVQRYKLTNDKFGRPDQQIDVWNKLNEYTEIPPKPVILDIGTGYTYLIKHLKDNNIEFTYYAIEINDTYINHLKKLDAEILSTDVDEDYWAVEGKNMFDIIIIRQTLDHFIDPIDVLRKAWVALAPKGVIFVSVNDIMKDKRDKLFITNHIHFLSKKILNYMASKAKLKRVADGYNGDAEYWAIYSKGGTMRGKFKSVYKEQKDFLQKNDENTEAEL